MAEQEVTKFKIKKQPMLVKKVPNRGCDFQWPYEEDLKKMMNGRIIKINKIEVWHTEHGALGGIRITLNNGEQSPYYKSQGHQKNPKTIHVDQTLSPAKINVITREYTTNALMITDAKNAKLCEWVGIKDAGYTGQKLQPGDQIVGIYGGRKGQYMMNFGFITAQFS